MGKNPQAFVMKPKKKPTVIGPGGVGSGVVPPTMNPAVVSLEMKEKERMNKAAIQMAKAKKDAAKAKAKVSKMALAAKAALAKAKNGEKGKLGEMKKKFTAEENEKMTKRGNKEKLEFAENEMRTKREQLQNRTGREKERAQKAQQKLKDRNAREAERVEKRAAADASTEVAKIGLAEKLKAVQEKKQKATKRELDEKAKKKKAGKKSIIRRTERGVKEAEKAAAVEREAKQRAISATEKRKKREADEAERQKEYERDAAKKIKADQAKAEEIGLAKVKAAALNAVAKKGLFNLKKEAKQMEVRAKERDKKKLEDAQEGIAKKKRVIKAAAKRAAENLSKQLLKKAMDKKRPERERGMKEFKADEKTKKRVKVNSEKNAKATEKKNTVKLDKKEKQFEQDKIAARAKIKKADAYAKEVASKAEPTSDSIKARAGAKGRIETAAAAERAIKYKEKNKKWMRKRYRVVWTKI